MNVNDGKLQGSTLVTGFHGVGETGYIAISYLVHQLGAKRIGFVETSHPPQFIATSDEGLVTPFEVYKKGRLVLIKMEFPPPRQEESDFAKTIARWAVKNKFRDAILIGGLDANLKQGKDKLRIVPTQAYLNKRNGFKHPTLEPGLYVYGGLAIMLSEFEMNGFPAIAVLPYASPNTADPAAAALAIRSFSKVYKMKVDVSDLERDAKDIEVEVTRRFNETTRSLRGMYS